MIMLRICRNDYPTVETAIDYTDLCLAFQLETNAPLDQFRAETALRQIVNFWPASLDPRQFEMSEGRPR